MLDGVDDVVIEGVQLVDWVREGDCVVLAVCVSDPVWLGESVGLTLGVRVAVCDGVSDAVARWLEDPEELCVRLSVGVCDRVYEVVSVCVMLGVCEGELVAVRDCDAVTVVVGDVLLVAVGVGVPEPLPVAVWELLRVALGVSEGV